MGQGVVKGGIRRLSERLYRATHVEPPPTFVRVSYQIPRQVVLLTAAHESDRNVWPIDWHIPLSLDPPLYGISLGPGFGTDLIARSGAFIIHFVPSAWDEKVLQCGAVSGRSQDKIATVGFETEPAKSIDAPRLSGALGWLECCVEQEIPVGDHRLFIARAVHAQLPDGGDRLHHVDSRYAWTESGDG